MPRNLLVIAKVCPNVDAGVDSIIARLTQARDLFSLMQPGQSGRGLLHWACWYDPWLMGNELDPAYWKWAGPATVVGEGLWELSLAGGDWQSLRSEAQRKQQFSEQNWLAWHLWQTYEVYKPWNHVARTFYGREAMGASLDDSEVLGEALNERVI